MALCLECVPDHIRIRARPHQNNSASIARDARSFCRTQHAIFMRRCGAYGAMSHSYLSACVGAMCDARRAGR